MDDAGQILPEHLPELTLDFALDEILDDGDRVKGAVDVDILERICFENERDAFLFRDNEDDVGAQTEMGQPEKHGDDEGVFGREHAARTTHEVDVWLFVIERVCLDLVVGIHFGQG